MHQVISDHEVTYPEFQAAKKWLMDVGEGGEWPLFLDVFVEHAVEEVAARKQTGTVGTILGPYYLPDQVQLTTPATLPARPDEAGTPLAFRGQVTDTTGAPVPGAVLDIWQADEQGYYSGFAPDIPAGNLRGVVTADDQGHFEITTIQPAPYQVPTDGPTGALISAPAGTPGARRTCTCWSAHRVTARSPPSCTSPVATTWTPTSPRRSSPNSSLTPPTSATAPARSPTTSCSSATDPHPPEHPRAPGRPAGCPHRR